MADTLGSANYNVGSQREALANSEGYSRVFKLGAAIIGTASGFVGSTIVSAPDQINSGFSFVKGTPPASVSTPQVFTRSYVADQEDPTQPPAQVWGPQPSPLSSLLLRQIKAAPEEVDSGFVWIVGQQPATASVVPSRQINAAPQQFYEGFASVDGTPPTLLIPSIRPPGTMVSAPQQLGYGDAWTWGPQPQTAAVIFKRILFAAREDYDDRAATVFHSPPPSVISDPLLAKHFFTPQQDYRDVVAYVFGRRLAFDAPVIPPLPYTPANVLATAFRRGYFGGVIIEVGDSVTLTTPYQYTPYWMTLVGAPPDDWVPLLEVYSQAIDDNILRPVVSSDVTAWINTGQEP